MARRGQINTVTVISEGEQIAYVETPNGAYVVTSIPDARRDTLQDVAVLKRVDTLDQARAWYDESYGVK
jgi:hypothetical protein